MYVFRMTTVFKAGRAAEYRRALVEMLDVIDHPRAVRIYYRHPLGPSNTITIELEYESMAEFEKSTAEVFSKPEWAAVGEKIHPLRGTPVSDQEFLMLHTLEELKALVAEAEAE